ncbi:methyltransferase domain-containing protein [Patulibacter sp. SYSU D01012]|uniref:SAM-dependent methyltransferase n=1 Tax=Patulibacter sp. SYSU D01012 TaxID=2817381 RepID=UPI001B307DCC|nr:methyltransferase domain-containing protein [Patulibacter sp. SYSU D01012]
MTGPTPAGSPARFWDDFYAARDEVWSGRANALLVEEAADLTPGWALDVGCGEGGDALWLAARGWRVTAVDVAQAALDRGARRAAEEGLADSVVWERHDLGASFPAGTYDLVSACYLHSPVALDRRRALRAAVAAVAPGGSVVVVSHAPTPDAPHAGLALPTAEEVLADLGLPAAGWTVERCATVERTVTARDGRRVTRPDTVVRARREA